MKSWQTWALRLGQIALTGGCLWWIARQPNLLHALGAALPQADWRWLAAGFALALLDQVFNIWRWGIYLRIQGVASSWRKITEVFMGGLFFNLIVPGMVSGDLVKVALFGPEGRGQWRAIMLAVIADRLIGLVALVSFTLLLVGTRYHWLAQTAAASALLWVLILFTIGSVVMLGVSFLLTRGGWLAKLPERFPGRSAIVEAGQAWDLFAQKWRSSLAAIALSFPVLFTYFAVFWCGARAFHVPVSLADLFSVMPVITIVSALPISISGIGVREGMFVQLLGDLAHVPAESAVLVSLSGFVLYGLCGIIGLFFCLADLPQVFALLRRGEDSPRRHEDTKENAETEESGK